jgi:alginate O-acetyltransferase complex protein AlgI
MVFASLEFLTLFLPAFLILYVAVGPRRRNATLLLCSWVFYGWWSPLFLILFIGISVLGWAGGIAIDKAGSTRRRNITLGALITLSVCILCWFKYANIVVETLSNAIVATGAMPIEWQRVTLPIGLSFIILQSISYLIDVQRRVVPADYNFFNFGAYQSMFVHLIAGPIIRYDWVKRELISRSVEWSNFALGARRFMVGMSMKVLIADTLAPIVNIAFTQMHPTLADSWLGCLAYSLQLFFDFAGYSAMAIGLGLMLGFHFPENFLHPYLAKSVQDFWRRWHISLSSWLRDYLYIPLGGNRKGVFNTYRNLLLTMAIAGLWHGGDSWNFLIWGILHGVALSVERLWTHHGLPNVPRVLSHVLTLLFVMLAWIIFRSHTFDAALTMYAGQFGLHGLGLGDALTLAMRPVQWMTIALGIACCAAPILLPALDRRGGTLVRVIGSVWPVLAFMLSFALIASRGAVPFLYFQF